MVGPIVKMVGWFNKQWLRESQTMGSEDKGPPCFFSPRCGTRWLWRGSVSISQSCETRILTPYHINTGAERPPKIPPNENSTLGKVKY